MYSLWLLTQDIIKDILDRITCIQILVMPLNRFGTLDIERVGLHHSKQR